MQQSGKLENQRSFQARKSQAINLIKRKDKTMEQINFIAGFIRLLPEFSNFMKGKDVHTQAKICSQIQYYSFPPNHLLFKKGDQGDAFYTILSGAVILFDGNVHDESDWKIINILEMGRSFGEKAIETEQGRMCHAICKGQTEFLSLTKQAYKELFSADSILSKEKKMRFIEQQLPNGNKLAKTLKEKVMFMMHIRKAYKREKILVEGQQSEALYFICEGECKVLNERKINSNNPIREFIILSKGSFFGEESILQEIPCPFSVIVSSDQAELMYIKKSEIRYLPELVMNQIRMNFSQKDNSRKKRRKIVQQILQKPEEDINQNKHIIEHQFRSANRQALKNIITMVQQRNRNLFSVEEEDNQIYLKQQIKKVRNGFQLPTLKKSFHQKLENLTIELNNYNLPSTSLRYRDLISPKTVDAQSNNNYLQRKLASSKSAPFLPLVSN